MNTNKLILLLLKRHQRAVSERNSLRRKIDSMKRSDWGELMRAAGFSIQERDIQGKYSSHSFIHHISHSSTPSYYRFDKESVVSARQKNNRLRALKFSLQAVLEHANVYGAGRIHEIEAEIEQLTKKDPSTLGKNWVKYCHLVLKYKKFDEQVFRTAVSLRTINKLKCGIKIHFGNQRSGQSYSRIYAIETADSEPIPVKQWIANQEFEAILE